MKAEKRIIFFYDGQKDLDDGYAREALRDDWHLKTDPQTQLVDISSGVPTSVQCDLIIVEDGVREVVESLLPAALRVDEIDAIGVCYGGTILAKLVESLREAPQIMTLDFELQDCGDITRGALSKTEELYSGICSDPKWRETVIVGITNHSRVAFSKKLVESLRNRNDTVLPKKEALWGILPDLLWDAIGKHRARVKAARQAAENQSLRRQLRATQAAVHAKYDLLKKTQHLIGMDAEISDVARAVQPYFDWLHGRTQKYVATVQAKLPAALLLRGEPGCGKSALCQCISEAFDSASNSWLPKTLGPKVHPGDWVEEFKAQILPLYTVAASTQKVVVIVADDLPLPSPDKMISTDMAADWKAYLQTLRDCVYDAIAINAGRRPSKVAWISAIRGSWNGRILWIFAKNIEDEYAAIVDLCRQYNLRFPSDIEARRRILQTYADSQQVGFAEDALELALDSLPSKTYRGRSFVGSELGGGGFAFWCVERAKELCREEIDAGRHWLLEITTKVVEEWLNGPQHRAIVARQEDLNDTDSNSEGAIVSPDQDARSLLYWESLVEKKLDVLEAAFPKAKKISDANGKKQVRLEDLAKALNCTHPVLSNFFNARKSYKNIPGTVRLELIGTLSKKSPHRWVELRSEHSPLKKYFVP